MISDKLASNFTIELLAYALNKRSTFEVVRAYLKYAYLQNESEKKLWQYLYKNYDRTQRVATIGQLQQHFIKDDEVLDLIDSVKDVEVEETSEAHGSILKTFQEYLKQMIFLESNDKIVDTYNRGDKDGAYSLFVNLASKMDKFSILDANFERVFEGFENRQIRRRSEDNHFRFVVPTGIDELDYSLGGQNGGPESGEYVLWVGDSGSGKSQCLIHLAITAARQAHRVVFFQLEGTKEQCLNRFDAAWTGTLYQDMKVGDITAKKMQVVKCVIKKLKKNDIFVSSCEDWGGKTLVDVNHECEEIEKKYGKIDVIVIDYLELLEVGDGIKYSPKEERFRQQKLSKGMKTLAMKYNAVVHTATQTSSISPEQKNDPDFVITRADLNEDKGKARPADCLLSLNSTSDERKEQFLRLYIDKAREHSGDITIHICNNFERSRFYDRQRTLEMNESGGWDEEE
jgi:replicative DNA helicase